MTRCNLLSIARVKQIVPRSQISSYRSSVLQSVQSSYLWHSPPHQCIGVGAGLATRANSLDIRGYKFSYLASNPFIWSKTTVGYLYSSAQSKVRKSLSRASLDLAHGSFQYVAKLNENFFGWLERFVWRKILNPPSVNKINTCECARILISRNEMQVSVSAVFTDEISKPRIIHKVGIPQFFESVLVFAHDDSKLCIFHVG